MHAHSAGLRGLPNGYWKEAIEALSFPEDFADRQYTTYAMSFARLESLHGMVFAGSLDDYRSEDQSRG